MPSPARLRVPVIASGGAGSADDVAEVLRGRRIGGAAGLHAPLRDPSHRLPQGRHWPSAASASGCRRRPRRRRRWRRGLAERTAAGLVSGRPAAGGGDRCVARRPADAGLGEPCRHRGDRAHRRGALLVPLARRAVAQGRDQRQRHAGRRRWRSTATPMRSSTGSSRPARPATRARAPASTAIRPSTWPPSARSSRSAATPIHRPRTPRGCSPAARGGRPRRSPRRRGSCRRLPWPGPMTRSWRRPRTSCTTRSCCSSPAA